MVYPTEKLPFEELTTIDERVDYIHNQLAGIQLALSSLAVEEGAPAMGVITKEVVLKAAVPKLTGTKVQSPSPLTGRITQVIRHWALGANALVDIAIGHHSTWMLPSQTDTFVALDDATPVIRVNEPIEKGRMLWMIVRNTDSVNPHTVTATFIIEGVE